MLKPFHTAGVVEAGCDEAGRGCLAGPVYAAAVILPPDFSNPLLDDSKKVNARTRDLLREVVEKEALSYAVGVADVAEIDQINILNASILAMHRALAMLSTDPGYLLIDGNRFKPFHQISHSCIIKGDGIYASIAAASILAKTYRDECMESLHLKYPRYGWDRNKGYPTKDHRKAILESGPTEFHRRSFRLLDDQTTLAFS
ncbi:MAG: ribonuclease HII [Bacteroidetes bacterium]|nr:ribonuclease HII [Bacteroidota bacterium]